MPTDLGFSTADAENVEVRFASGDLTVSFIDWREEGRRIFFRDALAFRWQELDATDVRDDTTYEVRDSTWLRRQAELQGEDPGEFVHYLLCFNAHGSLDILARRIRRTEEHAAANREPPIPSGAA